MTDTTKSSERPSSKIEREGGAMKAATTATPEQLRKFEEAARALEADDDPERFKERVRKLARGKPT